MIIVRRKANHCFYLYSRRQLSETGSQLSGEEHMMTKSWIYRQPSNVEIVSCQHRLKLSRVPPWARSAVPGLFGGRAGLFGHRNLIASGLLVSCVTHEQSLPFRTMCYLMCNDRELAFLRINSTFIGHQNGRLHQTRHDTLSDSRSSTLKKAIMHEHAEAQSGMFGTRIFQARELGDKLISPKVRSPSVQDWYASVLKSAVTAALSWR